ncbi:chemotaxis-specific protein-glutamate methyltransferase CheB [Rhabdaerophilum sp. SD176]|uniref:chemotaxis-specific protein-glutamate methyltransferase CheB n=1 Tax=Rhabdaerophilum sp. SD176 TaxID=2983548 RepID=UPI0024DF3809|nr:chemotaxis-specific protein-glutamate methyltransferase CheB [Rhabdaerophilum sp. SD176]
MAALPHAPFPRQMVQPVRVAVVDDSVVVRGLLSKWLSETSGIEVVGAFKSGREIIDALPGVAPRIILLDLDMPDMDGITALPLILAKSPQSRVIVVSSLSVHGAELTMRSLMRGATDYLPKPSNHREVSTSADFRQALVAKVLAVGGVRAITRAASPAVPARPPVAPPVARSPFPATSPIQRIPSAASPVAPFRQPVPASAAAPADRSAGPQVRPLERVRPKMVVIGASTGGPQALVLTLGRMKNLIARVPVVIAQHMPPIFGSIFASHLKQHAGLPAVEAVEGKSLQPGTIYLAPGGCHTVVRRKADGQHVIAMLPSEARGPWRPSIDLLFSSAAEAYGNEALAIALTGMGRDGTEGALHLSRRGANVLVQDEASSVVWGIPGSIAEAGLASSILPPEKIGELAVALLEGQAP